MCNMSYVTPLIAMKFKARYVRRRCMCGFVVTVTTEGFQRALYVKSTDIHFVLEVNQLY